jgi:peptide/nickel transport system ATP-binding protein
MSSTTLLSTDNSPQSRAESLAAAGVVLNVSDLHVHFETNRGTVRAVDGVSFALQAGERLGLVGESGSGKSTIALALLRLIKSPGRIASGEVILDGRDITKIPEREMRKVRMGRIALIPQGAMNSLNPVARISQQLADGMRAHDAGLSGSALDRRIEELLSSVGLRRDVAGKFPHELSGGMKQRVCIAMAISLRPAVIIADEPTSALDVVVQRQIMQTLAQVQEDLGAAVLLIGHDMGLMAQFVDRLGVMYGGKLMEVSPTRPVFANPLHPYTQLLIASLPSFEHLTDFVKTPGTPHSPLAPPPGCVFHPRCPRAFAPCPRIVPALRDVEPNQQVACLLYDQSWPDGKRPDAEPGSGAEATSVS